MESQFIILLAAAFLATFIQRVTGFGFGIVFMTVAPYLLPTYGEATALSGLLALICALVTGLHYFKFIPWKKLTVILLTFVVVSFFAVKVVSIVDSHTLKHVLGVILILVSIWFFLFNDRIHIAPSSGIQLAMGTISGAMGGLFGMQGPPAVIYFISCTDRKEEYMALTQTYFLIGNLMMTAYRAANGFVTPTVIKTWVPGIAAVLLGLLLGSRIYDRMPIGILRKFVYVFIGVSGIVALFA